MCMIIVLPRMMIFDSFVPFIHPSDHVSYAFMILTRLIERVFFFTDYVLEGHASFMRRL